MRSYIIPIPHKPLPPGYAGRSGTYTVSNLLALFAIELHMKTNLRFCPRLTIPFGTLLGNGTMLTGC
ncbi:MAG TPA: hypothetical protein VK638_59590, partial [Edaphobacter sp.]|nr:hypothetical protein [Edaphobacter sp.]